MSADRTPEQQAAVDCTDPDILVEAGAGSGKTKTTVDRYSRLIEANPDPARILVFTFTDKAATELRERVRAERELVSDTQGFSMSSAWVGTFHSICSRILRAHPIQADVDPAFAVLDDVQAARLKESAYNRALAGFMGGEYEEALIARFSPSHLRKGVSRAYEQLRARGQIEPALPEPEEPDTAAVLSRLLLVAEESLAIERLQGKTIDQIQAMINFFRTIDHRGLTFEAFEGAKLTSGSSKLGELKSAVEEMRSVLAAAEFGEKYRQALSGLFGLYAGEYSKSKRLAGVLDYEDLQLITLDLLRSHDGVANRYREQFDEIMVDEFQDTNQLQLDLIAQLRGDETTLFTVGDEMQAIYGFRHADVRLFRTRRDDEAVTVLPLSANFRSDAPVIASVNLIGKKLDDAASLELDEPGRARRHRFAPLRVGLESGTVSGDETELLVTESKGWFQMELGPMSPAVKPDEHYGAATDGQFQAEALLVAQHLSDAVRQDGINPGRIAILFRAKSRMWMYVEALKQVGLKPYVVGGTGFWESREGVDLKSLLAVIANPLDDDSLLGSLAGPACGLSTDALLMLRHQAGKDSALWPRLEMLATGNPDEPFTETDAARAGRYVTTIRGLRERLSTMSLGELVEAAVSGTGYDLVNLTRDPSGAGLANIRRVASLASDFESSERRDLRGFLEWVEISARLDSEAAVATEDEDGDAVQLMTVHKSKGLEFDLVCVADLGRQRKAQSEAVFWLGHLPGEPSDGSLRFGLRLPMPDGDSIDLYDWSQLAEASALEAADEELRLFHVALTRAKRHLVMSGVCDLDLGKEPGKSASTATLLASALGIDRDAPESVPVPAAEPGIELKRPLEETRLMVHRNDANADQATYLSRSNEMVPIGYDDISGRPPIDRPPFASYPSVPLSYSALSEFRECPTRFYASRILRLDPVDDDKRPLDPEEETWTPDYDGTRFGNAVHAMLERMAENSWLPPLESSIQKTLEEQGVDPADHDAVSRAGEMINGFTKSDLGASLKKMKCEAESNLLLRIGETTLRGTADVVVRESDPPLIVDYKSNRLHGNPPASKMAAYLLQRDLYGLAVAEALDVPQVRVAYVFLEAPDDPIIFEFGPADLADARTALESTVASITTGQYFTASPGAPDGPCGGCPACDRLRRQIEAAAGRVAAS